MKHLLFLFMLVCLLMQTPCPAQESIQNNPRRDQTEKGASTADMFGLRGGYIHPYLSVRGEYTDNLYNLNVDETTNFLTTVSPGIWFGIPRTKEVPLRLSPYNSAVGGRRYSLPATGSFNRFQAYMLGGFEFKNFSSSSSLNYTAWNMEGLFQYSLPAGISFRIMDKLTSDQDRFDRGSFLEQDFVDEQGDILVSSAPSRIRKFISNQTYASLNLDLGEKFSALLDYTVFYLDYADSANDWLDRTDNRLSLSLSYKYSLKTSFFVEYAYAVIDYNTYTSNDSDNIFMYGGINWNGSVKTTLTAKGGYQVKKYLALDRDEADTFTMDLAANYLVTDKTKISLFLHKALEETDYQASTGRDVVSGTFRYDQQFTYRTRGYCEFRYQHYNYEGFEMLNAETPAGTVRKETLFAVKPGIQYYFREWLMAELAYTFENRNSNDNDFDFTTQTVFLSLNASF